MAYSVSIPFTGGGTQYAKPVSAGSLPSSSPSWASDVVASASSNSQGVTFTGLTDGQGYWFFDQAGGSPAATDIVIATVSGDGDVASEVPEIAAAVVAEIKADPVLGTSGMVADAEAAATQTSASSIRTAVGLESANLASVVNAIVGKNNVTDNGNGTYDIAVRNAADNANLVVIRYNPTTGVKTVVS